MPKLACIWWPALGGNCPWGGWRHARVGGCPCGRERYQISCETRIKGAFARNTLTEGPAGAR
eukprot:scaffold52475_cov48-Phaeocystis_antarctica.AAC.1